MFFEILSPWSAWSAPKANAWAGKLAGWGREKGRENEEGRGKKRSARVKRLILCERTET